MPAGLFFCLTIGHRQPIKYGGLHCGKVPPRLPADIYSCGLITQGSRMLLNLRARADPTPSQIQMAPAVIFMPPPVNSIRHHADFLRLNPER
jgi:hypothetical protein